jgi:hypothetical protein
VKIGGVPVEPEPEPFFMLWPMNGPVAKPTYKKRKRKRRQSMKPTSIPLTQGRSYFLGFIFSHTHKRELQFLKNPLLEHTLPTP